MFIYPKAKLIAGVDEVGRGPLVNNPSKPRSHGL